MKSSKKYLFRLGPMLRLSLLVISSFGMLCINAQSVDSVDYSLFEKRIKALLPDSVNCADSIANLWVKHCKGLNDSLEAVGWYYKAEVAYYRGKFDFAGDCYKKSIVLMDKFPASGKKAIYYNNLGLTRYFKERYNEALEAYSKSAELENELGHKYGFMQCLHNIALVHDRSGNDPEAEKYFNHSLAGFFAMDSLSDAAAVYNDYAIYLSGRRRQQDAIDKYIMALNIYQKLGQQENIAKVKCNIGALYLYEKRYHKSARYLEESLNYFRDTKDSSYLINIYSLFGDLYYEQGRTALSVVFYDRAENVARNMGWDNLRQKNLYSLFKALKAEGDYLNAMEILETYSRLKDSLIVVNKGYVKTSLDNEIETELMEKDLNLVRGQIREKNLLLIILVLVLGLGVVIWFLYGRTRMLKSEREKRELKQKILHMQLNPQFIFNALSSVQGTILEGEKEKASDYLSRVAQLIRRILLVANDEMISLNEEMELIRMYLNVQCERYHRTNYCQVNNRIDSGAHLRVPPLMLRPLIDDIFAYGKVDMENNPGIYVSFEQKGNNLEVILESIGMVPPDTMTTNSLSLIEERLKCVRNTYPHEKPFSVLEKIDIVEGGRVSGIKIKYRLPLMREESSNK